MSNEQMKRIFDQSACLTPRQLKGYVSGSLVHEEAHAVEAHIMGCPFCSEAIEGIKAHRVDRSIDVMVSLTPDFLDGRSGFSVRSEATAVPSPIKVAKKPTANSGGGGIDKKSFSPQLLRTVSIAATVLIAAGVFWFIQSNRDNTTVTVADNATTSDVQIASPKPMNEMADAVTSDSALVTDNATADLAVVPDSVMQQANDIVAASADDANTRFKEVAEAAPIKKKDSVKKVATTVAMTTTQNAKKVPMTRDVVDRGRMGNSYTPDNASGISIGGARGSGTLYYVDGEQVNTTPPKTASDLTTAKDVTATPPKPLTADELYDQKKYTQALAKYKQEMQSSTGKDKEDAKLGVAKCYIGMGDNKQAVSILRGMLYDNSKRKKQAKKLLRSIGESDEE